MSTDRGQPGALVTANPDPILAYTRIERNRRNTAALLALVPLVLVPFAAGIVVYLLPWLLLFVAPAFVGGGLPLMNHPLLLELTAAAIVLAIMTAETLWNACLYRFAMLRATGTAPVTREKEPDLWRIVENLCIGAGLPMPRLYVVDSPAPNAFATGADPSHASLGVTRGLLALLDRRELEGVIAHELSHIGNHDTRLSTAVAAVVATLRIPIDLVAGMYRTLAALRVGFGIIFLILFFGFIGLISIGPAVATGFVSSDGIFGWMSWLQVFTIGTPWYVLFGAPAIGLIVRQAISRQLEFLADADAVVLTRDPEGLALALAKIGGWSGPKTFNVGPSAAHLCIANPLPTDSLWWDTIFPCHPSMEDRINLLSRMTNGIPESVIQAAAQTGATAGVSAVYDAGPVSLEHSTPRIRVRGWTPSDKKTRSLDHPTVTALYANPDGWSKVVCNLPQGTAVTLDETEGHFLRVRTEDGVVGYISESARGLKILTNNGTGADVAKGSIPISLFVAPDTWSTVLGNLPDGTVVMFCETDGRFLRVTTADNTVGYVVASACTPE